MVSCYPSTRNFSNENFNKPFFQNFEKLHFSILDGEGFAPQKNLKIKIFSTLENSNSNSASSNFSKKNSAKKTSNLKNSSIQFIQPSQTSQIKSSQNSISESHSANQLPLSLKFDQNPNQKSNQKPNQKQNDDSNRKSNPKQSQTASRNSNQKPSQKPSQKPNQRPNQSRNQKPNQSPNQRPNQNQISSLKFPSLKNEERSFSFQESTITIQKQLEFERNGHILLQNFFDDEEMDRFASSILLEAEKHLFSSFKHRVSVLCPGVDTSSIKSIREAENILRTQSTDEIGFLQLFNLHRSSDTVRSFVFLPKIAKAASILLNAKKVRLYQDCVFIKHSGYGPTNWHSDLNMCPIDTNSFVTFWITLTHLEPTDSRLMFASGSHRDFSLPYWQSNEGMKDLKKRNYAMEEYKHMKIGDITCHHGWTLHFASPQPLHRPSRIAFTISFFADGGRMLDTTNLRRKPHREDDCSYSAWIKDIKQGQFANHLLLPLMI